MRPLKLSGNRSTARRVPGAGAGDSRRRKRTGRWADIVLSSAFRPEVAELTERAAPHDRIARAHPYEETAVLVNARALALATLSRAPTKEEP